MRRSLRWRSISAAKTSGAMKRDTSSATTNCPVLVGCAAGPRRIDDIAAERRAVQHAGEQPDHQRKPAALVAADRQQHALVDLLRIGDRLAGLAVHHPAFLQRLAA